ncbi:hypothetical protein ROZALSC1DRAFT_22242 [Rozella allomycis CSF55]|uniref:F-box domain-containing protein n=1 Tax=Rozella allomycis (strain CSF55) TaxID=988480 RepID=A0A4V1IZW7_ROZAC|nr:hypothetical protein ROZALSC1DRAFT_22242 [Rozella allomycis CSF55]
MPEKIFALFIAYLKLVVGITLQGMPDTVLCNIFYFLDDGNCLILRTASKSFFSCYDIKSHLNYCRRVLALKNGIDSLPIWMNNQKFEDTFNSITFKITIIKSQNETLIVNLLFGDKDAPNLLKWTLSKVDFYFNGIYLIFLLEKLARTNSALEIQNLIISYVLEHYSDQYLIENAVKRDYLNCFSRIFNFTTLSVISIVTMALKYDSFSIILYLLEDKIITRDQKFQGLIVEIKPIFENHDNLNIVDCAIYAQAVKTFHILLIDERRLNPNYNILIIEYFRNCIKLNLATSSRYLFSLLPGHVNVTAIVENALDSIADHENCETIDLILFRYPTMMTKILNVLRNSGKYNILKQIIQRHPILYKKIQNQS